jgi:hypothetical protein
VTRTPQFFEAGSSASSEISIATSGGISEYEVPQEGTYDLNESYEALDQVSVAPDSVSHVATRVGYYEDFSSSLARSRSSSQTRPPALQSLRVARDSEKATSSVVTILRSVSPRPIPDSEVEFLEGVNKTLDRLKQVCGLEYFRPQSAADVQYVVKGLVDQVVELERRQRVGPRFPQELFHGVWTEVQGEHRKRQTCHTGEQWASEYRTALTEAAEFEALYRGLLEACRKAPGISRDPFQVNSDSDCEQFIRLLIHDGLSVRARARQLSTNVTGLLGQLPSELSKVNHLLAKEPADDTDVTGLLAQLPSELSKVNHQLAEESADDSRSLAAEPVLEETSVDEDLTSPSGGLTEAQLSSLDQPQTEGSGQPTTRTNACAQWDSQSDIGGLAPSRTTRSPRRKVTVLPVKPFPRKKGQRCLLCVFDPWGLVAKRCGVCESGGYPGRFEIR